MLAARLARQLDLSKAQARTLLALHTHGALDYELVLLLGLYPRDKAQSRVFTPLKQAGWIIEHSLPPKRSHVGTNRLAWSLNPDTQAAFEAELAAAQAWTDRCLTLADDAAAALLADLRLL